MKTPALLLVGLFLGAALAGCGGKSGTSIETSTLPALSADKGAISGIVVDDRYRPVPDAQVALTPLGITTTSDSEGQFGFGDLEPGAYVIFVNAPEHEAAPKNIDVVAAQYSDVEVQARRTFSDSGYLITTEYSIFISCTVDYIVNGQDGIQGQDCTLDQSGDTFRPDFLSVGYANHGKNATYLVAEMLTNKDDYYEVQLRGGCGQFATDDMHGTYSRIVLSYGNKSDKENSAYPNVKWINKCEIQTILFSDEAERPTLQSLDPTGIVCCGAAVHLGIKAKFVDSLFLGPPTTPIANYCVLSPTSKCT